MNRVKRQIRRERIAAALGKVFVRREWARSSYTPVPRRPEVEAAAVAKRERRKARNRATRNGALSYDRSLARSVARHRWIIVPPGAEWDSMIYRPAWKIAR